MQSADIHSALAAAVEEVLETMCFTTVLAGSQEPPPPEPDGASPPLIAELQFQGNPSGVLRVSAPLQVARSIAGGFLAREEDEISDAQAGELVCELANMICGSVLSRLESKTTFRITHPELIASASAPRFGADDLCRWFDLGDGLLMTSLQWQQGV